MALHLHYFAANALGAYVMDAWQKHLGIEIEPKDKDLVPKKTKQKVWPDPTSAQWFAFGPGSTPGLLGGLEDDLVGELVFGDAKTTVTNKELKDSGTHDNRRGHGRSATLNLTWTITNSATATHSETKTHSIGVSQTITVKGKGMFELFGSETTFDYRYTWGSTDTKANTETDSKSFGYSVPVEVPEGKVYRAVVMADREKTDIPYSAQVRLRGTSETNFPKDVKDPATGRSTKNHKANAGEICKWINDHGSAGWINVNARGGVQKDPMTWARDPAKPEQGIVSLSGTMKVEQSVNFISYVLDVTDSFAKDPQSTALINQLKRGETPAETVEIDTKPDLTELP